MIELKILTKNKIEQTERYKMENRETKKGRKETKKWASDKQESPRKRNDNEQVE